MYTYMVAKLATAKKATMMTFWRTTSSKSARGSSMQADELRSSTSLPKYMHSKGKGMPAATATMRPVASRLTSSGSGLESSRSEKKAGLTSFEASRLAALPGWKQS